MRGSLLIIDCDSTHRREIFRKIEGHFRGTAKDIESVFADDGLDVEVLVHTFDDGALGVAFIQDRVLPDDIHKMQALIDFVRGILDGILKTRYQQEIGAAKFEFTLKHDCKFELRAVLPEPPDGNGP